MVQHTTELLNQSLYRGVAIPAPSSAHSSSSASKDSPSTDDITLVFETLLGPLFPFRGFILFDGAGRLLKQTTRGKDFCQLMQSGLAPVTNSLPAVVQQLATSLLDSCEEFPDHSLQLYDSVFLPGGIRLHLNVEWIDLPGYDQKGILITVEDLTQIAHHRAMADAYRHGLTQREAEVWELYLQGLSYRDIGDMLFIAVNTVKKHMKNIYSKCDIDCRDRTVW